MYKALRNIHKCRRSPYAVQSGYAGYFQWGFRRQNSTFKGAPSHYDFLREEGIESQARDSGSPLPFDMRRNSETFGQIVRSEQYKENDELEEVDHDQMVKTQSEVKSPFRNEDGSFIKGNSAEEARLHDLTLKGRVDNGVVELPEEISKTINNHILRLTSPGKLREHAANMFQSISKEQLQKAPESAIESDAFIAALFLQDYANAHQVLTELRTRVGVESFQPKSVLDIGYGPATGMVALNEIMGEDFKPDTKDAYIVGRKNFEMKKRAKIILSRQLNEVVISNSEESAQDQESLEENITEHESENEDEFENEEFLGPVNTKDIKIVTKLRDSLPVSKQYDLIIVNQALLTREYSFPKDIDINIHLILRLLSPNGHLVLLERGNALGFETIARARQVMIRPESYGGEIGKIPRPYIKGSIKKPQKLKKIDQLISEDDVKFEEELLEKYEKEDLEEMQSMNTEEDSLEEELDAKYGKPSEDDLKFEFEDDKNFELTSVTKASERPTIDDVDYHISIVAPCSHQNKCPLQLGDPKYYKIPSHKHRLDFCAFNKTVLRTKYTMELKKGKRLATKWEKSAEDGFGLDRLSRKVKKSLTGTGRPGGNNIETGSYSYLIARRAPNDGESVKKIKDEREMNSSTLLDTSHPNNWPRIIQNPTKIKNNVKLNMCAPSGNIETWQIPKSLGKQEYYDARKASKGDLWALGKKSVIVKNRISEKVKEKLDVLSKTQKKTFLKEQRKKEWKKVVSASEDAFKDDIVTLADSLATNLEMSKKYKTAGKRAKYDVNISDYEGK